MLVYDASKERSDEKAEVHADVNGIACDAPFQRRHGLHVHSLDGRLRRADAEGCNDRADDSLSKSFTCSYYDKRRGEYDEPWYDYLCHAESVDSQPTTAWK